MFCNPSLQSFYSNLEATVYDEEVKNVKDLTLPDLSRQDEKVLAFLHQIDEEFGSVSSVNNLISKCPKYVDAFELIVLSYAGG